MTAILSDLKYTKSHEWVRDNQDGTVTVGITDHAAHALGELVYVELPELGRVLTATESCAVVESVKAASDVYAPVGGEVVAINTDLTSAPEKVNKEAYESGWLFRLKTTETGSHLLDPKSYEALLGE